MKKILVIFLLLAAQCKKDAPLQYGCEYGVSKTTMQREYIHCVIHDIYSAGTNQDAANTIADKNGVTRVDVSMIINYTNLEWIPNANCDCH